jgi:GxxExxY protein
MREPDSGIDKLAREVIGAAIAVHREMGPGFLESLYEEALCLEMRMRGIDHVRQPIVSVEYKGHPIGEMRLDLLVGNRLVVELKAVETLLPIHTAQVISYLRATGNSLGLLINFNVPALRQGIKRSVLS